ncbi:MAG: hydratase [Lachnospirales bacterium]
MVKLYDKGVYLVNGVDIKEDYNMEINEAKKGTIAYSILEKHNTNENMDFLKLKFDAMASHDITFVGIIQTAKASGMTHFPLPYVLTNCHNSLCTVGGTINEDDHLFGLSAAKKYGGIYVPPHLAVIHQYMREEMAGCGKMILGSDSHTRYGALGTMAIGEGGGELVKQLLSSTYDVKCPEVIGVYLDGEVPYGVGPQDIALAIIGASFKNGYVKNKVMEFVGPAIEKMPTDFRNGIDVMTTETTCLTSIWCTDEDTREYLGTHGRIGEYKELKPKDIAYYDGMIYVDLSKVKSMIALPFHPSNTYTIDELNENLEDILYTVEKDAEKLISKDMKFTLRDKIKKDGLHVQQGIIAGCAGGTYSNIAEATTILRGKSCGNDEFTLAVYPSSQPVFMEMAKTGLMSDLMATGAVVKTAYCGPCFGAGDTPSNNALSVRHATRNFPNREGSKPNNGQMSSVALMDARSIAATAINGGVLTPSTAIEYSHENKKYTYDKAPYNTRVYSGFEKGNLEEELIYGPNIKDWPEMEPLKNNILLGVCSKIMDEVTTTDELIPSGETSSYRSNPIGLAEFTLSRRDENYVPNAKGVRDLNRKDLEELYNKIKRISDVDINDLEVGSMIYCVKPGDGSAREQAASCQRVLGGLANICKDYATKRYRSNVMNWGMLPFQCDGEPNFEVGEFIFVPGVLDYLNSDMKGTLKGYVLGENVRKLELYISSMTDVEKKIVMAGSLINYNRG